MNLGIVKSTLNSMRQLAKRRGLAMVAAAAAAAWLVQGAMSAEAQVVTYYRPAAVYYAPAPTPYVAASPVPVTTYYAPAPPPAVVYQPVAEVRTRYRPILGGTVSRVRYGYAPVFYP